MKISSFIVGLLVVMMVIGSMSFYYAAVADNYGKTYDDEDLESYNRFEEIQEQAESLNQSLNRIQSDSGAADILGGLLRSGFTVTKTTQKSLGIFNDMGNEAINKAGLGAQTTHFRNYIILIVFIIFIFSLIMILVGREI